MKAKTILITGGAGFIGTNLTLRLLNEGHKVISVDNLVTGSINNVPDKKTYKNYEFLHHNVIEPLEIEEEIDEIYHLASPASPPMYQKDPVFTFRTNVWGAYNLLELVKKKDAKLLISSTSEIYGDPLMHPQKESYWGNVNPIGIRSCYDEGKRASETIAMDYQRQNNIKLKIIRIFNTYGPYMDPRDGRVVSNFVNQALRNEDLTIHGDGKQTRSFQYIDDLINGLTRMMASDDSFIGPVNLGNPDEFTISELAEKVKSIITDSKSDIIYKDLPQDDPKKRRPDITLAKEKLNWEPKIKLDEGLVKTIEYFKSLL